MNGDDHKDDVLYIETHSKKEFRNIVHRFPLSNDNDINSTFPVIVTYNGKHLYMKFEGNVNIHDLHIFHFYID